VILVIFVPIAKPVGGRCNMHCSYCYFKQKKANCNGIKLMSDKVLKTFIDSTCRDQQTVEIVWHGGEPLLVGIDFYRKVVEYESQWSDGTRKIFNSVQTNGVLVNKEWIDFFVKNKFGIGVSIDGPAVFHNKTRGQFQKIIRNMRTLQEAGILSGVICCVSSVNCNGAAKIFDFFAKEKINRIKFLQVQGRDSKGKLLAYSVDPKKYSDFLIQILEKWIELDNPNFEIREVQSLVNIMLGGDLRECMFSGECHKYFTVYPDGSVYGCDSLPKIESLKFGNISEGLDSLEKSPNFAKFRERIEEIQLGCAKCPWFHVCKGGCLQDWWPNIFHPETKNLFCEGLKKIFSATEKVLKDYKML
jgi:uncharacterized protein